MGVMTCHISDCENIMCNTYVDPIGYVCINCQVRFKEWMKTQSDARYSDSKNYLVDKLEEFKKIPTPIISYKDSTEIEERIDQLFSDCTKEW